MNNLIKLLTSTDTSTTTINSNKSSSNTNNSKNNTCSKLIPSRIHEEKNASVECNGAYAAIQDLKERLQILKFRSIERRIYAYCGELMLAGLKETKLP